ncbi:MAG TPA: zf-HC2 domain-containing protein [Verrucomicrobiae bacterium]|nr:zf-HC2 domain-containing protein [Verrucomicrobiae bacterium]
MKPCKSHQRQIAALAVEALSASERAAIVDHLRECSHCRGYAEQLRTIAGLYAQDAERSVADSTARPGRLALPAFDPWYQRVFVSHAPAVAAAAVLIICATLLFINRKPHQDITPARPTVAATEPEAPTVLSIGNSRRLTTAELEGLTPPNRKATRAPSDFVFSVGTRDDGS